jgi:hypothetical protein
MIDDWAKIYSQETTYGVLSIKNHRVQVCG